MYLKKWQLGTLHLTVGFLHAKPSKSLEFDFQEIASSFKLFNHVFLDGDFNAHSKPLGYRNDNYGGKILSYF